MNICMTPHEWSRDSLFNKAQRYSTTMLEQERDSWKFGFWSALTLELLARASLAAISPALVADEKDWKNIYYALGKQPNAKKYTPKTANTSEIFSRLENILPNFTREMLNFSVTHLNRRNDELHSGALPFEGLGTSKWLSMYYLTSKVLLQSLGEDLEVLFGAEEAATAETLISALADEAAKSVEGTIKAHREVWLGKGESEREKLQKLAETTSSRHIGHRVTCPSCASVALLHGNPTGVPTISLEDDRVVERQATLPSSFECVACGLKITGYSKLNSCGLGDSFTETTYYEAADYFGIEPEEDKYDGYEPDFNEY